MKRIFTKLSVLAIFCLLTINATFAQDITIKGNVKDGGDKSTIPSVSVVVKGTQNGAQTDVKGNFSISAPANGVLVFSYIGYTTLEVPVNNRTTINVELQSSSQQLEQVVVIGYGTQKRKDLTGSISSVSGDEVAKMPAVNPLSSLQGKVAGLTVVNSGGAGSQPVIRIRGISSTNSASPLYVVDGLLQDNIDYLNPADIESIDLLRDASSAAIYGLRGANGVIAVTTKRAARGQTRVNFTSNIGVQKVINKIEVADADGFKKLYSTQLANIGAPAFDFSNYTANTDWQDQVLRSAMISSNSLSFSNSGEKTTTLVNLSYNNQEGVVKYNSYEKYVLRLSEQINVTDKLKIGGDVTGFFAKPNGTSLSLNNAIWAAPIVPVQLDENTYYSLPSFQRAQVGNPVAAIMRGNRTSVNKNYRFNGSIFAELTFLKDFKLKSTLYGDFGFSNSRGYSRPPFSFINIGENGAQNTIVRDDQFRSTVSQSQFETHRYQQDHTLTYEKSLEGGHRITALAGFTSLRFAASNVSGSRTDSTLVVPGDPDLWYLGVVNPNNILSNGGDGSEESNVGAFARLSYVHKDKYLFNGTIRRDGSSRFSPQNRWGTFGSVGLGWVASEETFFKENVKGIDYLKLRLSWGRLGNSNGVSPNLYQQGLSNGSTAVFGENVYTAIQNAYIPDPNLRFEIVQGLDVGLDLKAFKNRFNAEINLYDKTTDGILTSFPLLAGQLPFFTNLGKINNKGIEVSLGWSDKIGELSYNFSGNFSYNRNRVESLGNTTEFQITGNAGVNLTNSGQSIGYFYGYRQIGIYQTAREMLTQAQFPTSQVGDIAFEDVNGDGIISPLDRTYLGTPFPPYSYGLSLSLGYKSFDFLLEGQGVAGNEIYAQRRTSNFAPLNYESNRLNAWTGPGTSNVEPILDNTRGNNFQFSSYFLEPGDYFRLRTIQLGYTFAPTLMNKIGAQKLRIYVSGQNVQTWTQATGYTPEAQIGSILGGGADNGVYPVPAIYSFGLNVTF
ncbi:SusC/RagA family TonB-linked outer membrane protein [Pedobacter sandarakinus]|uniref:SusC/RagA family TonB-linked outer membrane protein n=1 Tax=Pedobacter sandarakinus TaxID=353156 RepID=UPI002246B41C|nr:TonB-dependent receptor [Pedobacter sandarakinus]MCX2572962.1 TonB-dependent receptor [Pedobacter sandarakinus]